MFFPDPNFSHGFFLDPNGFFLDPNGFFLDPNGSFLDPGRGNGLPARAKGRGVWARAGARAAEVCIPCLGPWERALGTWLGARNPNFPFSQFGGNLQKIES